MKTLAPMLKSMIEGIESRGGDCDTVVCGSDEMAGRALAALAELKRDFHVIADNGISSQRMYVTSQKTLNQFPGSGRN